MNKSDYLIILMILLLIGLIINELVNNFTQIIYISKILKII